MNMEKEINDIILHNNIIQDPTISEKIEIKIQKENNITIPSIILEYISNENECFDLEDQKKFFNHFGEVLNLIIIEKKSIVLFKTFFIANICLRFLQNENHYKENTKSNFSVRWFNLEKDENLLLPEIKPLFKEIYSKNLKNLKPKNEDIKSLNNLNNSTNNSYGIKMNMNMNINNFNINTTMNPMAQNPNIIPINNYQYLTIIRFTYIESLILVN